MALLGSVIVSLAAIHSVNPANADPVYSEFDNVTYAAGATDIPSPTARDVDLTITDPIIHDARYVTVDSLTFPGKRYQTIDTGITADGIIDSSNGVKVEAQTSNVVGGGYLFSTSGVFRSTGGEYALVPRYGLFYGYTNTSPFDNQTKHSATRVTIADYSWTSESSKVLQPLDGTITTTLSNPTTSTYKVAISINGTSPTQSNVNKNLNGLSDGGPGPIVIGGVNGTCLEKLNPETKCEGTSTNEGWKRESTYVSTPNLPNYHTSMFQGSISQFRIYGKNNALDFDGVPAYDLMTGYCGFYDIVTSKFTTAETPSLVTCTPPTPTMTLESVSGSDSPNLVFTYARSDAECAQAKAQTTATTVYACMAPTADGKLRLSVPSLPAGWALGPHSFLLTVSASASQGRTTTISLFYVPEGTLNVVKQAWMNVPAGADFQYITSGQCNTDDTTKCINLPNDSAIPSGSQVTFTFSVTYSVTPVPQLGVMAGRYGLPTVVVTDQINGGSPTQVCTISDILVSDPPGSGTQNPRGCAMEKMVP